METGCATAIKLRFTELNFSRAQTKLEFMNQMHTRSWSFWRGSLSLSPSPVASRVPAGRIRRNNAEVCDVHIDRGGSACRSPDSRGRGQGAHPRYAADLQGGGGHRPDPEIDLPIVHEYRADCPRHPRGSV